MIKLRDYSAASQPSASQPSAAQPSASQPSAAQPSAAQPSAAQPSAASQPSTEVSSAAVSSVPSSAASSAGALQAAVVRARPPATASIDAKFFFIELVPLSLSPSVGRTLLVRFLLWHVPNRGKNVATLSESRAMSNVDWDVSSITSHFFRFVREMGRGSVTAKLIRLARAAQMCIARALIAGGM